MKFLLYSPELVGGAIGVRLKQEGNEVEAFVKEKRSKHGLDGLLPKVNSLEEGLSHNPDVVIFDYCKSGDVADDIRKKGFRVLGGSKFADLIELDRGMGIKMAEKMGLRVPPYQSFGKNDIEKAIEFIQETGERYVLKPDGNLGAAMTYVSADADDMIQELEHMQREKMVKGDFILQEFIPGVEISTEAWYSKGALLAPFNGTLEQKHYLSGDLGPNTGCESSVVWAYPEGSKIADLTIVKLDPVFKKMGYTGPIDINCIIADEDGQPYFLEYTPRFGYSAFYALTQILEQDIGELFYNVAEGTTEPMPLAEGIGASLTVSMPPYPLEANKETAFLYDKIKGRKIMNPPDDDHWFPGDVMLDENKELVCAGGDGLIGFITGRGSDLEDTMESLYDMAREIEMSDKGYRNDADDRVKKNFPKLESMDYELPTLSYEKDDE